MLPIPQTHVVTAGDLKKLKVLGFTLNSSAANPQKFFNSRFPNFNVLHFAQEVDNILHSLTTETVTKEITIQEGPPIIYFQYYSANHDDAITGLAFSRIFRLAADGIVVEHDFFRLPQSNRGQGIAKLLLRASLQEYVNIGVKRIYVHAALQDGGYVWARNFFTATEKREVKAILDNAERNLPVPQFKAVKRIYLNYYSKDPSGTAFPIVKWAELPFMKDILRGSDWHGVVDLTNAEQFSNFIKYINEGK